MFLPGKKIFVFSLMCFLFHAPLEVYAQQVFSEEEYPVDKLTSQILFVLNWDNTRFNKNDFNFSLRSPYGETIDENNAPRLDIETPGGNDPDAGMRAYRVFNPQPGPWTMIIGHPPDASFSTTAMPEHSGLRLDTRFLPNTPVVDEPLILTVTVTEPEAVLRLYISARITRYEQKTGRESSFELVLVDNGSGDDKTADDGTYTATFYDTSVLGSYCADISLESIAPRAGHFRRSDRPCTVVSTQQEWDRVREPPPFITPSQRE